MRNGLDFIITILIVLIGSVIYITNFIQMIVAISNEQYQLAIIKAIGVFTALGSIITVWF